MRYEKATEVALSLLREHALERCPEGYGVFPKSFVSMRTARELVREELALCSGKVGDKDTVLFGRDHWYAQAVLSDCDDNSPIRAKPQTFTRLTLRTSP